MHSNLRKIASAGVLLLLALPLADQLPDLRWNLNIWSRLSARNSAAPDTGADDDNRSLLNYLPANAVVGFVFTEPMPPAPATALQRTFEFVRYSFAPHRVVMSADVEFVVECGPATSPASLATRPEFTLVKAAGDDVRLFRRVPK